MPLHEFAAIRGTGRYSGGGFAEHKAHALHILEEELPGDERGTRGFFNPTEFHEDLKVDVFEGGG